MQITHTQLELKAVIHDWTDQLFGEVRTHAEKWGESGYQYITRYWYGDVLKWKHYKTSITADEAIIVHRKVVNFIGGHRPLEAEEA